MPAERIAATPPVLLALVMADEIRVDPASGKRSILGIFDAISASSFPCLHPLIAVYAALTDGHGPTPVRLRLVDVDETRPPIFDVNEVLQFPEPMALGQYTFEFNRPVLPAPGHYRLQFFACGELLRELSLKVNQVSQGVRTQ